MKLRIGFFTLIAALTTALPSQAGLILSINSTDKTFALLGSDTGMPGTSKDTGSTVWTLVVPGVDASDDSSVRYNNGLAFSTSVGTPGNNQNFDF